MLVGMGDLINASEYLWQDRQDIALIGSLAIALHFRCLIYR